MSRASAASKDSRMVSKMRSPDKLKPNVRIIHIFSPEIIQADDAEHFRDLVQRLTGKPPKGSTARHKQKPPPAPPPPLPSHRDTRSAIPKHEQPSPHSEEDKISGEWLWGDQDDMMLSSLGDGDAAAGLGLTFHDHSVDLPLVPTSYSSSSSASSSSNSFRMI